ncbi:unnamed protein product, partial [Musa acuminata subsp. burmannicoides]
GAHRPRTERLQVPSHGGGTLVDYLANWSPAHLSWPRCRLRGRLRHRAVESSRQRSAGGLFLCGAQAQEQRRLARRSKGRQRFLTLYKSKKPLSPWSAGARWWSGERAAFLQRWPAEELRVDDVRVRDVFVWRLRDTSSLSRQEKLALCLPGGTTIKTVETTLTEAATDTVTGDSFVGRKRNRDESSTLGKSIDSRRSHAGSWLHIPAEHCSRTSHHIQPRWCNPTSHHLQPRWCNPTSHHLQPRWCNILIGSCFIFPLSTPVAPNEAGVAAASPSSMDVGGGEIPITTEELEAFLASSSSSVDLGGEQNCTDDAFFAESLKPCRCRMTPTQPRLQTRRPHRQPL